MTSVVVIDYGTVNLKNIIRGLEYVGGRVDCSVDPDRVMKADRVILPGVGAFGSGIKGLRSRGMDDAIRGVVNAGRPLLGICLGMQMLLDSSSEYGNHKGLGLIPGSVVPIPTREGGEVRRKIPHIGWNALGYPPYVCDWRNSCLDNTPEGAFVYFIHSFMAIPNSDAHVLSQCIYEGITLVAAIAMENITGVQFHPERSGSEGLRMLRRFMAL